MASEIAHLGEPGVPAGRGIVDDLGRRAATNAAGGFGLAAPFCAGSRQLVDVSVSLCPADSSWSRPHRIVP